MNQTATERLRADRDGIARAASLLRAGGLVGFQTETVYGLGADATDDKAVACIYAAKQRPSFNPLICHVTDADAAWKLVQPTALAVQLADRFWPGPLTLVLPRQATCSVGLLAGAGLDTLAVRVPASSVALDLLRQVDRPIAAPSANRSGRISPTSADHVLEELDGCIAAVLDSGPSPVGLESTVLDLSGPRPVLLRAGGVTLEMLIAAIGPVATHPINPIHTEKTQAEATQSATAFRSPGLLASHYAPSLPVRLGVTAPAADEALLAFGPPPYHANTVFQLSEACDLAEAASNLFAGLRTLDRLGAANQLRGIAAMPIPDTGLGLAINDRLQRAAAPRPSL
jgi:L-threonylcarbamoyladenylate synthase